MLSVGKNCNADNAPPFSMSAGTNADLLAYYNALCGQAQTHGVDYLLGMDTKGNVYDPAMWGTLFTRAIGSPSGPPPVSLFPASSVGKPMPLNDYYSIAGPWWAKQMGFAGLGDDSAGGCEAPYVLSSQLGLCVDPSSCGSGWKFDSVTGVCFQGTGVMAWLQTGNNGVYAALGGVGLLAVLGMMGRR